MDKGETPICFSVADVAEELQAAAAAPFLLQRNISLFLLQAPVTWGGEPKREYFE